MDYDAAISNWFAPIMVLAQSELAQVRTIVPVVFRENSHTERFEGSHRDHNHHTKRCRPFLCEKKKKYFIDKVGAALGDRT